MKSSNNYLKLTIRSLTILGFVFLFACSNQSEETAFEEQKKEVVAELEKMKSSINDAIEDVEDKLNINEGPVERSLEEAKADLESKKEDIEEALESAKNSTKDNWETVKADANRALSEIEEGLNKVKKDIEEALKNITE